jgi:hypothetical protein
MKKTTETHKFKRGQKLRLDDIYMIQGLAGGKWWTAPDCSISEESDEDVTITEDITITITVSRPANA